MTGRFLPGASPAPLLKPKAPFNCHKRSSKRVNIMRAQSFAVAGRPDKVVETVEAYMRMKGTDPDVLIRLGEAYRKLGRLDDVRRRYIRASQFGPLTEGLRRRLQDR